MNLSRRKLLAGVSGVAALTMLSAPARAAFSLVASSTQVIGIGLPSTAIDTTGANLIVVCFTYNFPATIPITIWDNKGNGLATTVYYSGPVGFYGGMGVAIWANPSNVGSGHQFYTSWGNEVTVGIQAWSGFQSLDAIGSATSSSNVTSIQTSLCQPAPGCVNELMISCLDNQFDGGSSDRSIDSGFTLVGQDGSNWSLAHAYKVKSSSNTSEAPTWSWTSGGNAEAVVISFRTMSDPAPSVVTWNVAYNGDLQLSNTDQTVLDTVMGTDLTYVSLGRTCPSTAADSTHIYVADAETAASIVGHPIQWKSGNICVALSQTTSGGHTLVTVGVPAGSSGTYSANFGGTPQSGDAYTIYPYRAKFSIGAPASGHTQWQLAPIIGSTNRGAVNISPTTNFGYDVQLVSSLGSAGWAYNAANGIGTPLDGPDQISIKVNGGGGGSAGEIANFLINTDNILFLNLQLWNYPIGGAGDGIANTSLSWFANVKFYKCLLRGESYNSGDDHWPMGTGGLGDDTKGQNFIYDTCVLVAGSRWFQALGPMLHTCLRCTMLNIDNVSLVATSMVNSGSVIPVASTTGIYQIGSLYPSMLGHPAIPDTTYTFPPNIIASITAGSITMQSSIAVTGTINVGDTIYVGIYADTAGNNSSLDQGRYMIDNCAVFGFIYHGAKVGSTASIAYTNCATDYTAGVSGLTAMNYANQFVAASGAASGGVIGTIDARPKAGNSLGIGTTPSTISDIFGNSYAASNPSVGAIQYQAPPAGGGTANFFHASPI